MNRLNLDSNFVSDYSCLQGFPEAHLMPTVIPTDPFSSQPSMAGYSAQALDSFHNVFLNQKVINQDTPSSPRLLNDFSISHLLYTTNKLMFPELSSGDLDEISSCDFASEPVNDNFSFTDSTFTNSQQLAQKLTPENSLVSFSQPSSRPVAIVGPLNKDTQEQVTNETIEFTAPESPGSGELLPLTLAVAPEQSGKGKTFKRAWVKSEKVKTARKVFEQSEKRKAYKRAWAHSEKGRACNRAYEKSEKGKASRKAYEQSEKRKAYRKSEEAKAYQKAYYEVSKSTGDKEQAKIAAMQAAALIRKSNKAKNNELESTSTSPSLPAFQNDPLLFR